mgnify:CR=1 FL=1
MPRTRTADTGETILSGLGDSHVEVALEKIRRKFSVDLEMATPREPYRETVQGTAQAEYTHKKQTGFAGRGKALRMANEKAASLCLILGYSWFESKEIESRQG